MPWFKCHFHASATQRILRAGAADAMYDPLDGVVVVDDATDERALNRQLKRRRHWETLVGEW